MTLDLEETFIYDSIVHAYNFTPENFRREEHAQAVNDMLYDFIHVLPDGCKLTREGFVRDWQPEETANMLFLESHTDMATFQPTPLSVYKDGLSSVEKAKEVKEHWPERFHVFAAIDPLRDGWRAELEEQVEELDPVGLKLYPSSWTSSDHDHWTMEDEDVIEPVLEHARDLDIDLVGIHKSLPFGPIPRDPYYNPKDVAVAAEAFPDIEFMVVHGGIAFAEEMAWLVARFPNVSVNLESFGILGVANPTKVAEMYAELMMVGGEEVLDQLYWSSAAGTYSPQPQLEAFRDLEIPDDIRDRAGMAGKVPQITDEHKRKILGENYADLIGFDIDEAKERIADDEFSRRQEEQDGLADPLSTTDVPETEVV